MDSEALALSKCLSDYFKVDMTEGIKQVEESIDDTLTRLDEFTGVIDVLRKEGNEETALAVLAKKAEMLLLFEKIRKLERIVDTVKNTVESVEQVVVTAETELTSSTRGELLNLFMPFVLRAPAARRPKNAPQPQFTSPEIYNTKELFTNLNSS